MTRRAAAARRTRTVRVEAVDARFLDTWYRMPRYLRQSIRRFCRTAAKWQHEDGAR